MSAYDDYSVSDAIHMLQRNWFMSNDGLIDFLWCLSQEVYDEVLTRKKEFHPNIQYWLTDFPQLPGVRDYTEKEWDADKLKLAQDREKAIYEFRKEFVPPPRPKTDTDEIYDTFIHQLKTTEEKLVETLAKVTKRRGYIAPNKRTPNMYDNDPEVQALRKKIDDIKNEMDSFKKVIELSDKIWTDEKFIDALSANAKRFYAA